MQAQDFSLSDVFLFPSWFVIPVEKKGKRKEGKNKTKKTDQSSSKENDVKEHKYKTQDKKFFNNKNAY